MVSLLDSTFLQLLMMYLDLSLDARIQYVSDSIEDVLGYRPTEVTNKSCWEYFHPDEIPFAKAIHGRGIELDKAAVLNYCRIKHSDGSWVSCECVFTVVYDVLVSCTSIYKRSFRSQQRAAKTPAIRRIFSSSPRDPRYHMLSYISNKFVQEKKAITHEPRAALFINRFTRTSTIMFATSGVADILGLQPEQLVSKSFYFCIAENCLQDAVRCVESAKANDSIAYLRFWFRNPAIQEQRNREGSLASEEDEDEGGVRLARSSRSPPAATDGQMPDRSIDSTLIAGTASEPRHESTSQASSSNSAEANGPHAVFDPPALQAMSSASSIPEIRDRSASPDAVEVEAVVSCTSDGLVVILRKAQPIPQDAISPPAPLDFNHGVFASPWAPEPVIPGGSETQELVPEAFGLPASTPASSGPSSSDFMRSIREVAVFAWSLTGINGSLSQFSRGRADGEALPPDGLPVWDPAAPTSDERFNGFADNSHRRLTDNDATMRDQSSTTSSEDEIVYRRAPVMPPWKPLRRGRDEAFGPEGDEDGDTRNGAAAARRRRLDQ